MVVREGIEEWPPPTRLWVGGFVVEPAGEGHARVGRAHLFAPC